MDRKWFFPCATITCAVYLAGQALLPFSGIGSGPLFGNFFGNWLVFMGAATGILYLVLALRLMWRRVDRPTTELVQWTIENRDLLAEMAVGLALIGLVSMGFGWVKTQLDYVFPFWADPLWADMDRTIFGVDPYIPLHAWLGDRLHFFDWVYSLWFPATVLSVAGVFLRRDNAAIIAYFLTWSVFGLVIQAIGSSAGPVYWARIGLGDRFDAVIEGMPRGSRWASDYLWKNFAVDASAVGSGISAMPSLHVAMGAWIAIAFRKTIFAPLAFVYWILVFIGSVALGWHYFVDGFVGSLMAMLSFAIAYSLSRNSGDSGSFPKGPGAIPENSHRPQTP